MIFLQEGYLWYPVLLYVPHTVHFHPCWVIHSALQVASDSSESSSTVKFLSFVNYVSCQAL